MDTGTVPAVGPAPARQFNGQAQGLITDPILARAKAGVEARVSPRARLDAMRIENAGLEVLTAGNMPQLVMQKLRTSPDIAATVAAGVANIIATVFNQVAAKIPPQQQRQFAQGFVAAVGPASVALMCQVLGIAEKSLGLRITPQLVARCAQATTQAAMQKMGIGDQQVQQLMAARGRMGGA